MTRKQELLLFQAMPFIGSIINEFTRRLPDYVDRENISGAGYEGAVKATYSFDVTKKSSYKSYLYTRVRGSMLDACRVSDSGYRKGSGRRFITDSFETPISVNEFDGRLLLGDTISTKDFSWDSCCKLDLINRLKTLTERERFILFQRMLGLNGKEIGELLNITESRVSQIKRKRIKQIVTEYCNSVAT